MKRLYRASEYREFCFIFDSARHKSPEEAAAYYCRTELSEAGTIEEVYEIKDEMNIPDGWSIVPPLGLSDGMDCEDFLRGINEAGIIAEKLKDDGYDLEETFVEDLYRAMKK